MQMMTSMYQEFASYNRSPAVFEEADKIISAVLNESPNKCYTLPTDCSSDSLSPRKEDPLADQEHIDSQVQANVFSMEDKHQKENCFIDVNSQSLLQANRENYFTYLDQSMEDYCNSLQQDLQAYHQGSFPKSSKGRPVNIRSRLPAPKQKREVWRALMRIQKKAISEKPTQLSDRQADILKDLQSEKQWKKSFFGNKELKEVLKSWLLEGTYENYIRKRFPKNKRARQKYLEYQKVLLIWIIEGVMSIKGAEQFYQQVYSKR